MTAGWVLLVHDRGLSEREQQQLASNGRPITTITTDVRTALGLVGQGLAEGLVVATYEVLSPVVVPLGRRYQIPPADGRLEVEPARPGQRRPAGQRAAWVGSG